MTTHAVHCRNGCYQLTVAGFTVSADKTRFKAGNVWCSLAIYQGTTVLYRDSINLGTVTGRAKLTDALADKNITVPEDALLALEEAIRQQLTATPKSTNGKIVQFPGQPAAAVTPKTLAEVHETFQKWLRLPDTSSLDVTLATVVANHCPGDPVWLLIVDAPGSGKTEVVNSTGNLPHVHALASLTEAYLLSGISEKDRVAEASGGFLKEIGTFGILAIKDFGSILSLQQDTRATILQALREIYDGQWSRGVGTDGGLKLEWSGKLGIIGGATPAIDRYHAVLAALGERFVFFRPVTSEREKQARAHRAIRQMEQEPAMRSELREVVNGLFAGLDLKTPLPTPDDPLRDYLVCLASLATHARSPVDRDRYSQEIIGVPEAEHPARLAKILTRIFLGLIVIGVKPERAWQLTRHTALSSIPRLRYLVLTALARSSSKINTSELTAITNCSPDAIKRAAYDLVSHRLVRVESGGSGHANLWGLTDDGRRLWQTATSPAIREALEAYVDSNTPSLTCSAIREGGTLSQTCERERENIQERVSTSPRIAEQPPNSTIFACPACANTECWEDGTGERVCSVCTPLAAAEEDSESEPMSALANLHPRKVKWSRIRVQELMDQGMRRAEAIDVADREARQSELVTTEPLGESV